MSIYVDIAGIIPASLVTTVLTDLHSDSVYEHADARKTNFFSHVDGSTPMQMSMTLLVEKPLYRCAHTLMHTNMYTARDFTNNGSSFVDGICTACRAW